MLQREAQKWQDFNENKVQSNYPQWPNEVMVKLVFGDYLKTKIQVNNTSKVLDIGCGFGNNLLPFLSMGCQCFGIEVTQEMASQTQRILEERGYVVDIKCGKNTSIPFGDHHFDLILSINVIHYESTYEDIKAALQEYSRILKKGGRILIMTVGPEHSIIKRAKVVGPNNYEIQNYDFRDGSLFFCFNSLEYLDYCMSHFFSNVEVGRVTENLMTTNLDFFIAICGSKK
ncbi:MAG: class I SAM-dependent methyltransferase [Thermodesulfobacteriota bacterium]